jgi:hypothetical protein
MNFNRRDFLKQSTMIGLVLPFDGMLNAAPIAPNKTYLDLISAIEISRCPAPAQPQVVSILDLSSYSDADPAAIKHLSKEPYDFVTLGLAELTPALAAAIAKWVDSPFFIFEKLYSLDRGSAQILSASGANLDLGAVQNLSGETVEALAQTNGHLHLSFETISLAMGRALKKHNGSLSLDLSVEPTYGVALELANHQGHELFIYRLMQRPSEAFISAFSSNIEKTVNFERQPISGDFYFIELMRV